MRILIGTIKVKLLQTEVIRFVIAGSFNTLFCYAIFVLSLLADLTNTMAMTIATLVTIFVSFFVMSRFVFVRDVAAKHYLRFFVMQSFGYLINIGILQLVLLIGISGYIGGIVSLSVAATFTFFVSKYLVFA